MNRRRKEVAPSGLWPNLEEQAIRMRKAPTPAEDVLWQRLRGGRLDGLKFRRQHAVGRFIVDFYCVSAGLAVEVDGPIHAYQIEADEERQRYLEARGMMVLRFRSEEVLSNLEHVISVIKATTSSIMLDD